jgi:hypothetical protein
MGTGTDASFVRQMSFCMGTTVPVISQKTYIAQVLPPLTQILKW